jgi:prepilin-type N-terminal cleavage/methylation domain-containing protein
MEEMDFAPKNKSGFTLVEMLIVVGIMALLSAMTLVSNRSSADQLRLFKDEATVVGVLNRAKALAAEKFNDNPDSCAFGVHFESNSRNFTLFQDLNTTASDFCKEFGGQFNSNFLYDAGESIQAFSLEPGLVFDIGSAVDVLFVPPELTVTSTASLPFDIVIRDGSGAAKTIVVNETGQINAE